MSSWYRNLPSVQEIELDPFTGWSYKRKIAAQANRILAGRFAT